jgi:hypothetical protein
MTNWPNIPVGYTGFEPVTSALSRLRSKPTELITLPFYRWTAKIEFIRGLGKFF